jgi:predicted esterase
MMKIKSIQTSRTARYILSTEPSEEIKNLWIVCHGYGQSALGFLNYFKPIFSKETLVVAPEGLSKFYWDGFDGKVVSSWMTKENRENEINDYVNFIENVVNEIKLKLKVDTKYNALGFSQGTATIARWANCTKTTLNSIHIHSGLLPEDIFNSWKKKQLPKLNFHIGDNDPFIKETEILKLKSKLNNHDINFDLSIFKGRHSIESNYLKSLINNSAFPY